MDPYEPEEYYDDLEELGKKEAFEDLQAEKEDPEYDCDCGDCPECEARILSQFADPGGNSALRAASPSNPRNLPCPNCGRPNRLTPEDRARGYQCDSCADAAERGCDY